MATYRATRRVTIGSGEVINTNTASRWAGTNRFDIGDTANLTAELAKQYAQHFEADKTAKESKTTRNKEKKAGKNK